MIDDGLVFDGGTPALKAMGGPEKAFASLPAALARRGHEVSVVNRCRQAVTLDGVDWLPWESPRPGDADIIIALRNPGLLGEVEIAAKHILWLPGRPDYLNRPVNQKPLDDFSPIVVFYSAAQRAGWRPWRGFEQAVVQPGVRDEYLAAGDGGPAAPPTAVIPTHPRHGLDWMLRLWTDKIFLAVPGARLKIYSAALHAGTSSGEMPEDLRPVFDAARDAGTQGVEIVMPASDPEMAASYRAARVHLYPGGASEIYCSTLAESQAAGLPAVALAGRAPPAALAARINNGQTGYLVPDQDAFANVAINLLADDDVHAGFSRDARLLQGGRNWDVVASEFESLWR